MSNKNEVIITTRDKVMKAWQNSMEMVRDNKHYAQEEKDSVSELFNEFAEEIGPLSRSPLRKSSVCSLTPNVLPAGTGNLLD